MNKKQIASNNPMQFMHEVVKAAQDGYVIDESEEFSIGMCKADDDNNPLTTQPVKKLAGRPKSVN
jgi:hypothetical protein